MGKKFPSLPVQKTQKHLNGDLGLTSRHCSVPTLVPHTNVFVYLDSLHRTAQNKYSQPRAQSDRRRGGCRQVGPVPGSSRGLPRHLLGTGFPRYTSTRLQQVIGTALMQTSGREQMGWEVSPQLPPTRCQAEDTNLHSSRWHRHHEFTCVDYLLYQLLMPATAMSMTDPVDNLWECKSHLHTT